jgi:hypothetical protein
MQSHSPLWCCTKPDGALSIAQIGVVHAMRMAIMARQRNG